MGASPRRVAVTLPVAGLSLAPAVSGVGQRPSPTRAALGFSVAKAAIDEGHRVTVIRTDDGVLRLRHGVLVSLVGLGTGAHLVLYDGFVAKGGCVYVSSGSARARGVTEADLAAKPAGFGVPPPQVTIALEHDRVITY